MPENRTNYTKGTKSHFIRRKAAQNVFNAADFALHLGKPLNLYVVINLIGAPKYNHKKVLGEIMQRYRRWNDYRNKKFRTEKSPPYWVYTIENNLGNNPHANWIVRIPDGCIEDFELKVYEWCRKVLGYYSKKDIYITHVNMKAYKQPFNYILKGVDPHYVKRFHLRKFYKGPQGVVYGCRARVSTALSPTARRKANFNATEFRHRKMEQLTDVGVVVSGTKLKPKTTYKKAYCRAPKSQRYYSRHFKRADIAKTTE